MLPDLLARLAALVLRRPVAVVLALALPALALAAVSRSAKMDLTFSGLADETDPQVALYLRTVRALGIGGEVWLLVEGAEDGLDAAVQEVIPLLEARPEVKGVLEVPGRAWFETQAPWLVEPAVFERWLDLARAPADADNARRLGEDLRALQAEAERLRPAGRRLVQVALARDPTDLAVGGEAYFDMERAVLSALEARGLRGAFAGLPAIGAQDQRRTFGRFALLSPLTGAVVLLILATVERSALRLGAMALPMVLSAGATLGIVGLMTGSLTAIELYFGVLVFGLGDDFALHLLFRLRQERAAGHAFADALSRTLRGAGPGVLSGALCSVAAFAVIALTPDAAARHFGLSAGLGVLLCALLMVSLFPALLALIERLQPLDPRTAPPHPDFAFVRALAAHAVGHPRLHLGAAFALAGLALAGLPRFAFEADLQKVFNRSVPAVQTSRRVLEVFGLNINPWIVPVDGEAEAERIAAAFEAEPLFASVEGPHLLVRPDRRARLSALEQARPAIERALGQSLALLPFAPAGAQAALRDRARLLDLLLSAAKAGPPAPEDLPPSLRARYYAPDGRLILYAYTRDQHLDARRAERERAVAQAIAPQATSLAALLSAMMKQDNPWLLPTLVGTVLLAVVVLALDFRATRPVIVALAPVVLGGCLSVGLLCWIGRPFNILTTFGVPLIVGLGLDDGIHLVHRIQEEADRPIDEAAARVAMPVVITTLTTCLAFAALLFTDHPGMESLALVLVLSLPVCLLASVSTIPALAVLVRLRG